MIIDNASWHVNDAANKQQAAIHIALVFFWLVNKGFIQIEKDELHDWPNVFSNKQLTPANFFLQYSDGKLILDEDSKAAAFLGQFYENTYLDMIGGTDLTGITRNPSLSAPYNILDSWENVGAMNTILDNEHDTWLRNNPV